MADIHSTGRGGAGNIGKGEGVYTDGSIVREGPAGESADGLGYSSGRGGAGNVLRDPTQNQPAAKPTPTTTEPSSNLTGAVKKDGQKTEDDYVPEPAMRTKHQEVFHTGRGGEGNIHREAYGGHSKPQTAEQKAAAMPAKGAGLGEKIKHVLGVDGEKSG